MLSLQVITRLVRATQMLDDADHSLALRRRFPSARLEPIAGYTLRFVCVDGPVATRTHTSPLLVSGRCCVSPLSAPFWCDFTVCCRGVALAVDGNLSEMLEGSFPDLMRVGGWTQQREDLIGRAVRSPGRSIDWAT